MDELSVSMLREFLRLRNAAGSRWQPTVKTFTSLLDFLRDQGIAVVATPPNGSTPAGAVCDRFRRYLVSIHTKADLAHVQKLLNSRPRPTLSLDTPAQRLNALIAEAA